MPLASEFIVGLLILADVAETWHSHIKSQAPFAGSRKKAI